MKLLRYGISRSWCVPARSLSLANFRESWKPAVTANCFHAGFGLSCQNNQQARTRLWERFGSTCDKMTLAQFYFNGGETHALIVVESLQHSSPVLISSFKAVLSLTL